MSTEIKRVRKFRRRLWREHWRTGVGLVAVNLFWFLVCNVRQGSAWSRLSDETLLKWGALYAPLAAHGQPWRLLTATFLHVDAGHLVGNLIALFLVSRYVDYLVGRTQTVCIYLATGVLSGLAQALAQPNLISVGASGAIMGLEGVVLAAIVFGRPDGKRLALAKLTAGYLVYHALSTVLGNFAHESVANAAQLTGVAAGFVFYLMILKFRAIDDDLVPVFALGTFVIVVIVQCAGGKIAPTVREGQAILDRHQNVTQLIEAHDRFTKILTDLARVSQTPRSRGVSDVMTSLRVRDEILPKLNELFVDLRTIEVSTPEAYAAQTALYYQVSYTRQSLEFALAHREEDQVRAVATAKVYGAKAHEAFLSITRGSRSPASVPL